MQKFVETYILKIGLALYVVGAFFILFFFDGTGERGSGDSILHFIYSKYAMEMPELLLNQWAKPMYVLLTLPFAQFGLKGVMFFNIIISGLSAFFTYKTTKSLAISNASLSGIILLFTPLFLVLSFSGLTEPLFAFVLIYSTYLYLNNKVTASLIILSFLPFVRSEGLLMIGVFGTLLLVKKQWKQIALLSVGHIFYSIIGLFAFGNFFWLFVSNPYGKLSSTYGGGELFHFVHQLFYVIGAPIYFFFVVGVIALIFGFFKKTESLFSAKTLLIYGTFFCFLVAHSLFWYLGIFNSMGLKRVMISVAPQIAIIALLGINFIHDFVKKNNHKTIITIVAISSIIVFPFIGNKASIDWEKDFSLSPQQQLTNETISFLKPLLDNKIICYTDPYISELLDINPFDKTKRLELNLENIANLKSGSFIIWDNWYGIVENGIQEAELKNMNGLKEINRFSVYNEREITYTIFQKQ